mgnify:CR=1 FL=1
MNPKKETLNRKIFLDVGAHWGETIEAVLDDRYKFDRIICFEPSSKCWKKLYRFNNERIIINKFGLYNKSCSLPLYSPGSAGASIFKDKYNVDIKDYEICKFVKASDWFKENITFDDIVYLKLNCEGAEVDILDDLLASGEYKKVKQSLVSFDVRKIPSMKYKEIIIKNKFKHRNYRNLYHEKRLGSTHVDRIRHWLDFVDKKSFSVVVNHYYRILRFRFWERVTNRLNLKFK